MEFQNKFMGYTDEKGNIFSTDMISKVENKVDFAQVNILRSENSLPNDANRKGITEKIVIDQVQKHFNFWIDWETETHAMLMDLYNYTSKNLMNPTKASVILNLAKTVEDEIKYLNRMIIDIFRDSQGTYLREDYQTRIHGYYKEKAHALNLDKVMEELGMQEWETLLFFI